jgi:hypothetical protein
MSKNTVKSGRAQVKIWRMEIAYWIHKAANTRSEYVLLFHCNNGCRIAPHSYVLYMYVASFFYSDLEFPFANL